MELSIVVPAAPDREDRLRALIARLSLNALVHPDIPFELIVVDSSELGQYRKICENLYKSRAFPVKYVWNYIEPEHYPVCLKRNQGFRIAEGTIFAMLDIDHYVSEHYIEGATRPFKKENNILNTGYMIDTDKSAICKIHGQEAAHDINAALISDEGLGKCLLNVFEVARIPKPRENNRVWLWAAPAKNFIKIQGYDERYVQYSREDDNVYHRLRLSGLTVYNKEFETFCGLHLYHKQPKRQDPKNEENKKLYKNSLVQLANTKHNWGKLVGKHAFSVINGQTMCVEEHENYVKSLGRKSYDGYWKDYEDYLTIIGGLYA